MITLTAENFDAATPPALPSNWVGAANMVTQATVANSSPNALQNTGTSFNLAYWNTDDGNGGDARSSVVGWATLTNGSLQQQVRAYCRMTATGTVANSTETAYFSSVDFSQQTVTLGKVVSGTSTVLTSRVGPAFGTTDKYRIFCECLGSAITLRIQRLSDSKWLDSSNAWQVAQQDYLSATSTTITGAGRAGIGIQGFNSLGRQWADDFLFENFASVVTRRMATACFI